MKLMATVLTATAMVSGCAYTFDGNGLVSSSHAERSCVKSATLGSVDQFLAAGEATAGIAVALSGMERSGIDGHRLAYGTFAIEAGILHAASSAWSHSHACSRGPAEQVGVR